MRSTTAGVLVGPARSVAGAFSDEPADLRSGYCGGDNFGAGVGPMKSELAAKKDLRNCARNLSGGSGVIPRE